MNFAGRIITVMVATLFAGLVLQIPAHEFGHCIGAWVNGHDGPCRAEFYLNPIEEGAAGSIAHDDPWPHAFAYFMGATPALLVGFFGIPWTFRPRGGALK